MGTITERTTKRGTTVYDAAVRRRGAQKLYRTFPRLTDAKRWVQDTESDLRIGRHAPQPEARQHTLGEAIDRFLADELSEKRTYRGDQTRHLNWFKKKAGFRMLAEVSPALLSELKSSYLRGTTRFKRPPRPQTWNRYISTLSCVFQCCVRNWEWLETNPARRIRRKREAPGRIRFLSDDERTLYGLAARRKRLP